MHKIVLFGDSIFNGYRNGRNTNLVTSLFQEKFPQAQIQNLSISGGVTTQALSLVKDIDPDCEMVIVEYGTNDSARAWGIPLADYAQNLEQIINRIGPKKVIIVGPSLPDLANAEIRPYYDDQRLNQYNQAAKKIAGKYDLVFVDLLRRMRQLSNPADYYQKDGLHLTDLGNQLLTDTIAAKISL